MDRLIADQVLEKVKRPLPKESQANRAALQETYPEEPRVHGAEGASVLLDGVFHLEHVVHEPFHLERAEVRAQRQSAFLLCVIHKLGDATSNRE